MRIKKIWITILLICCSILLLASCKEEHLAKSIALDGYSSETPLECTMGKFSYKNYTVSVTYDDGKTEQHALTENMISETDKLKFYQEGTHSISLTYKGATTSVQINVLRNKFSENIRLDDFTATYTGEIFTVEVEGDIPGEADILYPQGNTFQNAGSYDMTAVLQCEGYETITLSARVQINKATYDVSNAQLYDDTVVYDKDAHALSIKGQKVEDGKGGVTHTPVTIPQGVSVRYSITKVKDGKGNDIPADKQQLVEGNKAIYAGIYKVCAHFKGDVSNYNLIPDSVAYLTIERNSYDLSKVEMLDVTTTYSGKAHAISIAENSKLPADVVVAYQIKRIQDGEGKTLNEVYKDGNKAIDAGVYLVKASFSVQGKNAENYTTSPTEMEAYLTIRRASYDEAMQNFYFDSKWEQFVEDKTYEMYFECELPEGVTPQFTVTNEQGGTIQGEMTKITSSVEGDETVVKTTYKYSFRVATAGDYACVVTFVHSNENYATIALVLKATLYVENAI